MTDLLPNLHARQAIPNRAPWGESMRYSRAMRVGDAIEVSGTTAVGPDGQVLAVGDVAGQVRACLEIISDSLVQLGATLGDVVRTRLFVTDVSTWREAGRVHDDVFGTIAPVSSLVGVAALLHPDVLVEIEASAVVGSAVANEPVSEPEQEETRLLHTSLTVASLESSLAFYRDALGMQVDYVQEKRGGYLADIVGLPEAHVKMAQLSSPRSEHRLELFEYVGVNDQAAPQRPWDRGISHICLGVTDIEAVLDRVLRAGIDAPKPVLVDTGANRGGRGLYFRDPDGVTIELFQARSERA
jgi:enamine deaminase RidA (YjgF/YER057c/UK114 family)/catechol 2,3-dioxygenase-like lactoylglutathione lyase family enzyme